MCTMILVCAVHKCYVKILIILPKVQVAGYCRTLMLPMYVALHEVT